MFTRSPLRILVEIDQRNVVKIV